MATVTGQIVADTINYLIEKSGNVWQQRPAVVNFQEPDPIRTAMRAITDRVTTYYNLLSMVSPYGDPIYNSVLTPAQLLEITSMTLFVSGVDYNKVTAFIGFAAMLGVQAAKDHLSPTWIYVWVTSFIDTQLGNWLAAHGNWQPVALYRPDNSSAEGG